VAPRPKGEILCGYLILTGVARFLIEFIRINPRSFFGLSNAQTASLGVDRHWCYSVLADQEQFDSAIEIVLISRVSRI